jgi:hypothetical protein
MKAQADTTNTKVAWAGLVVLAVLMAFTLPAITQNGSVGSFEIDGNLVDPSPEAEPIDWSTDAAGNTPHPGLTNRVDFVDGSGRGDNVFGQGSKELEPGAWSCLTGSAPGKDDILKGSVAVRAIGQKRFMYVNFFRSSPNGDAHMDYEFNQSAEKNPACPDLPKRTAGDVLLTFDTESGGSIILVRAFKWEVKAGVGTFTELPLGDRGVIWDAAVNIPNTIPGAQAGVYGEAVIDLGASPLQLLCPEFVYMKTRASTSINAELKDRTTPQRLFFGDRPDLANASDSAFGVLVSGLGISQKLVDASTSQQGVGSSRDEDRLATVTVPNPVGPNSLVHSDLVVASSESTITEAPAQARHTSISEVAQVSLLGGFITADFVRAEATALATGSFSSFSSIGSTLKNVHVGDTVMNDVTPNTRVDLPAGRFGPGSYVILYERFGTTSTPPPGSIQGGIYAAELTVNMIHVFVSDLQPNLVGNQRVEVIVANAVAKVDFPQTELCFIPPDQTVSGHAFIASAATEPSTLPTTVGFVSIPQNGGHDHQNLAEVEIVGSVEAGASQSDSSGALTTSASSASSFAQAKDVCVLPSTAGCTVSTVKGTVVKTQSNSKAGPVGVASSNDDGTELLGLVVMGTPVGANPEPNTVIDLPGIGFLILNEQFCDNQGTLAANCSDGSIAGHAGLTVRALRLVVTVPDNALGLQTGQVIVAESHSDAAFK